MGALLHLQLNSNCLASSFSLSNKFSLTRSNNNTQTTHKLFSSKHVNFSSRGKIRAVGTLPESQQSAEVKQQSEEEEQPLVNFAFVSSVLLPDGTPDIHYRTACGGQKLRDIMLDSHVELYGPYARLLLNCGGGGICASCVVEVIEGKELLTPRTDKEKELLKKKPKSWRLACQTTVGNPDSRGLVAIQQMPEWKGHEWSHGKALPSES